jgi:hypothetical protein
LTRLFGEAPKPAAPAQPRAPVVVVKQPEKPQEPIIVLPPYQIEVLNGATRSEAKFARPPEAKQ